MSSSAVRSEVCVAIRGLLASIPSLDAPVRERAAFLLRKAEVFDLVSVSDAWLSARASELAAQSRYQARLLGNDY